MRSRQLLLCLLLFLGTISCHPIILVLNFDGGFFEKRYKKEAYRHSEFAPRILADNGIRVVMKVCHFNTKVVVN